MPRPLASGRGIFAHRSRPEDPAGTGEKGAPGPPFWPFDPRRPPVRWTTV